MIVYGEIPTDPRVRKTYDTVSQFHVNLHIIAYNAIQGKSYPANAEIYALNHTTSFSSGSSLRVTDLLLFWIYTIKTLILISSNNSIDIIHAHDFTTLLPIIPMKLRYWRVRLIYDAHELAPEAAKEFFGLPHMIISFLIEVIAYPFISAIITVSPMQSVIIRRRYHKPVYCVRNLPNRKELDQSSVEQGKEILDQFANIDVANQVLFIYASHISENRGFDELIGCWKEIQEDHPNYHLILAGAGPYLDTIRDDINSAGNITYVGYLDVLDYYSILRVCQIGFCLIDPLSNLNNFIGYPNKITEYFALNKFVISTKLLNFIQEVKLGNCIMMDEFNYVTLKQTILNLNNVHTPSGQKLNSTYLWEHNTSLLHEVYSLA